jgi:hypothetical protein
VASAIIVVVTGPIASQIGQAFGIGDSLVRIWDLAKWPVLLIIVSLMLSLLYKASPNVKQPGFRWITSGGVIAVVLWLIASGLFATYVAFFGSYNKTYGSLATLIIFLVWLWLTNIAILLVLSSMRKPSGSGLFRRACQKVSSRSPSCATPGNWTRRTSAGPKKPSESRRPKSAQTESRKPETPGMGPAIRD